MIQFKSRIALQVIDNIYIIFLLQNGYSCGHKTGMSNPNIAARANIPCIFKSLCAYSELLHLTWIDPSSSCSVLWVQKLLGWRNISTWPVDMARSVSPTRTCWAAVAGPRGGDTWHGAADRPVGHLCALIITARDGGVKLKRTKRGDGKKEKFKQKAKHFNFSKGKKKGKAFQKIQKSKIPFATHDHFL